MKNKKSLDQQKDTLKIKINPLGWNKGKGINWRWWGGCFSRPFLWSSMDNTPLSLSTHSFNYPHNYSTLLSPCTMSLSFCLRGSASLSRLTHLSVPDSLTAGAHSWWHYTRGLPRSHTAVSNFFHFQKESSLLWSQWLCIFMLYGRKVHYYMLVSVMFGSMKEYCPVYFKVVPNTC